MNLAFSIFLSLFWIPTVLAMQSENSPLLPARPTSCSETYLNFRPLNGVCPLSCLSCVVGCFGSEHQRSLSIFIADIHLIGRVLTQDPGTGTDWMELVDRVAEIHSGFRSLRQNLIYPDEIDQDFLYFLRTSTDTGLICPMRSSIFTLYASKPHVLALPAIVNLYWSKGSWMKFADIEDPDKENHLPMDLQHEKRSLDRRSDGYLDLSDAPTSEQKTLRRDPFQSDDWVGALEETSALEEDLEEETVPIDAQAFLNTIARDISLTIQKTKSTPKPRRGTLRQASKKIKYRNSKLETSSERQDFKLPPAPKFKRTILAPTPEGDEEI